MDTHPNNALEVSALARDDAPRVSAEREVPKPANGSCRMHGDNLHLWRHAHTFDQDRRRPGERRTIMVIALTGTMMVVENGRSRRVVVPPKGTYGIRLEFR